MGKPSGSKVSARLFVQMYMESVRAGHTLREFADRIGMSYNRAGARAHYYRKRGVELPALRRADGKWPKTASLDVAGLNELVDRMLVGNSPDAGEEKELRRFSRNGVQVTLR